MRFTKSLILTCALAAAAVSAHADGALDFLDPCIKAKHEFPLERAQILGTANAKVVAADAIDTVPPEYKAAWWKDTETSMHENFDKTVAPLLLSANVTPDEVQFGQWRDGNIKLAGGREKIEQAVLLPAYRAWVKSKAEKAQADTTASYNDQADDLDSSCKMGVGDQAFRVYINATFGTVARNFEDAKSEHNVLTQAFKAFSGVSPASIADHGLAGSDGSEVRKAGVAVNNGAIWVGDRIGIHW